MVSKLRIEIMKFEQKPHESLFEARERYKLSIDQCPNHNMLLVTQIDRFYNGLTLSHRDTINAAAGGTFMQKTPEECYELIKNMTAHHNHWDTSSPEIVRQLGMMNKIFLETMRQFQTVKVVDTKCETYGGPHYFTECPTVSGYTQEAAYATTGRGYNFNQAPTYQALTHQPQVAPQVDFQNYMKENDVVIKNMQTQMTSLTQSIIELENMFGQFRKMNTASSSSGSLPSNTVPNPREDLKAITTQSGVTLAGPSVSPPPLSKEVDQEREMITDQKLHEKDDNLALKFVEIFRNLHFKLTFADALLHMPKFALMFKSRLSNKEKFFDLAMTSVNENCSAVILKKLPKKLEDPGKFHFPTDFVVVDYVVDPRVPLIHGRPFLRTERALIDVYGEELTLCVDDEAITFKFGQTSKYSYNDAESITRIDVIDGACEEYV
nr:hypothetical protein [Tanacetum cinerariifolium]